MEILLCYASKDELAGKELAMYLGGLKRQGFFTVCHEREISEETDSTNEIDKYLDTVQIILLLLSPNFMNLNYCYRDEMVRALKRHERGEAKILPVLLRHVYWQKAPIASIPPLPANGKPIMGPDWYSLDEAFFDVAENIRRTIEELSSNSKPISNNTSEGEQLWQY
jgi:TIR domain